MVGCIRPRTEPNETTRAYRTKPNADEGARIVRSNRARATHRLGAVRRARSPVLLVFSQRASRYTVVVVVVRLSSRTANREPRTANQVRRRKRALVPSFRSYASSKVVSKLQLPERRRCVAVGIFENTRPAPSRLAPSYRRAVKRVFKNTRAIVARPVAARSVVSVRIAVDDIIEAYARRACWKTRVFPSAAEKRATRAQESENPKSRANRQAGGYRWIRRRIGSRRKTVRPRHASNEPTRRVTSLGKGT